MPDSACGPLDASLILLVALLAVVGARGLARRACRKCGAFVDRRAWRFCAKCGSPRGESDRAGAPPSGTKVVAAPPLSGGPIPVLPSELLRRGWCREAALDDCGYEVFPTDGTAAKWSIWGACDMAFEPHSHLWRAFRKHLDDILSEQFGAVSVYEFNSHPARHHATVLAVASEAERRAGMAREGGGSATGRSMAQGVSCELRPFAD